MKGSLIKNNDSECKVDWALWPIHTKSDPINGTKVYRLDFTQKNEIH